MCSSLAPGGVALIESPYAYFIRDGLLYDYVFHEHVCYWTLETLSKLLKSIGLCVTDVSFAPMNGGSSPRGTKGDGKGHPLSFARVRSILMFELGRA